MSQTTSQGTQPLEGEEEVLPPKRRLLVALAIIPAGAMQGADTFAVSVALPTMMGALSATITEISWVLTSYLVAGAIFTPLYAWMSRKIGRRRMFIVVVLGFMGSAIMVSQSTHLYEIIVFRFCQGIFGAGLNPLTYQVVLATFPRNQQGPAFGWLQTGRMTAVVIGPIIGGALTELFGWRTVFLINVPLGIIALSLLLSVVPKDERLDPKPFDFFGFAILSIAIAALQLMLDQGEKRDWFASSVIVGYAMVAASAFWIFLIHAVTARQPYLNLRPLQNREFVLGITIDFFVNILFFGYMALLPAAMQRILDFPVLTIGLVMVNRGLGTMASSLLAGYMLMRFSPKPLIGFGVSIVCLSTYILTTLEPGTDKFPLILAVLLQGFGMGFMNTPTETAAFKTVPPSLRPDATSLFTTNRRIAAGIGIAFIITQLVSATQDARSLLTQNASHYNEVLKHYALPEKWSMESLQGIAGFAREIDRQAEFLGYLHDFQILTWCTIFVVPLVLLMRIKAPEREPK
jgi:DHA2 family multidrug resistance protein